MNQKAKLFRYFKFLILHFTFRYHTLNFYAFLHTSNDFGDNSNGGDFLEYMTDLALERFASHAENIDGVSLETDEHDGVKVTLVRILSDGAAEKLGKAKGNYYTLQAESFSDSAPLDEVKIHALREILESLLPKSGSVLVAGIGNADMTSDALGPMTANAVFATRGISQSMRNQLGFSENLRCVSSVSTGVLGKTGIESGEYIKCICDAVKPSCVVTVDALCAADISRLGNTVQISDTGISPGSGVGNARKRIDFSLLGVPVIAIGVPTVTSAKAFNPDGDASLVVTPKDVDMLVKNAAALVAFSLNMALQPSLSAEEIYSLS